MERKGIVTDRGNPVTLVGPDLKVGERASEFSVIDEDLNEVNSRGFTGKVLVIRRYAVAQYPVCDMQARKFKEEAAKLPGDVAVVNLSMDLPFAIARFCAAAGIDRVKAYCDHRKASSGTAFGVLMKEPRLLARSIFVIDREGILRYKEIVPEISEHPDYERAIGAIKELI